MNITLIRLCSIVLVIILQIILVVLLSISLSSSSNIVIVISIIGSAINVLIELELFKSYIRNNNTTETNKSNGLFAIILEKTLGL